ncbi:hypothetical protein KUDE01_001560 [Dissostichus eleginoides]|uniref:Uncharacterized protein n=1 Tax=Dissostichus eleginoides TaxID=100907 RepID=A0AAD9B3X9_DISEL|nr:hypothetical protein KUDE01_001560 [Dissostichus eleginoides]
MWYLKTIKKAYGDHAANANRRRRRVVGCEVSSVSGRTTESRVPLMTQYPRMQRENWAALATLAQLTSVCCVGAELENNRRLFIGCSCRQSWTDSSLAAQLMRREHSKNCSPNNCSPNDSCPNNCSPNYSCSNNCSSNYSCSNNCSPNDSCPNNCSPNYSCSNNCSPNDS